MSKTRKERKTHKKIQVENNQLYVFFFLLFSKFSVAISTASQSPIFFILLVHAKAALLRGGQVARDRVGGLLVHHRHRADSGDHPDREPNRRTSQV